MAARTRLFKVSLVEDVVPKSMERDYLLSNAFLFFDDQELKEIARSKDSNGIELIPNDSNIFLWRALIEVGPHANWLKAISYGSLHVNHAKLCFEIVLTLHCAPPTAGTCGHSLSRGCL